MFIRRINQLSGRNYRLPTEAEWEFAARGGEGGKGYRYAGSNDINEVAWYSANSSGQTQPVGKKAPNELGLYDMTGNAWEWCSDWFIETYYQEKVSNNPTGPSNPVPGDMKVLRGGSWYYAPNECRIINRDHYPMRASDDDVGFRIVEDVKTR